MESLPPTRTNRLIAFVQRPAVVIIVTVVGACGGVGALALVLTGHSPIWADVDLRTMALIFGSCGAIFAAGGRAGTRPLPAWRRLAMPVGLCAAAVGLVLILIGIIGALQG